MKLIVFRVSPKAKCGRCGRKTDAATDPKQEAAPKPGDLTVCFNCQNVMVFYLRGGQLHVRNMPTKVLMNLPPDVLAEVERLQKDIRQFHEAHPEDKDE